MKNNRNLLENSEFVIGKERLLSLDVLRGLTIAAMILVNDPGSWSHLYAPLQHAAWHGITPTDLVFPFFLYIVGVSIVLSLSKQKQRGVAKKEMLVKIVKRSLIIFLLGIFLWLFPLFDFSGARFVGVLQRIAVVFFICAMLYLNTPWRAQAKIGVVLLLAYWLMMICVPVPIDDVIQQFLATGEVKTAAGMMQLEGVTALSENYIYPNLKPGTNLEAWFDRRLIPGRLYQYTWDPEGFLSTLPSVATGITGMLSGRLLLSKFSNESKLIGLFAGGFILFLLGCFWSWFFPINKNLWTSSYVLYTSGLAILSLGLCILIIDVFKYRRLFKFAIIFGANAIAAYVLHSMLARLISIGTFNVGEKTFTIKSWLFENLVAIGLSPKFSSLLFALLFTFVCFLPIWYMYRKKIFLKV